MTWTPELHPRDSSGRWAAAQGFADAVNTHLDRAEADAKRAGLRFVRRAKQEYDFIRSGKQERDDPTQDQRTADAKEAVTRAVSDALPGPMLDYFGGDVADHIAAKLAGGDEITEDDWSDGVDAYRTDQAGKATEAGKQAIPAKYHAHIAKYEGRTSDHLAEHGRLDAKKVFAKNDIELSNPPMPDNAVILCSRATSPFAKPRIGALNIGGAKQPVYYLSKEIIPINDRRRHPDKGYDIHVSPERADGWIQTFSLMTERGQRVPAPPTHKDTGESLGQWVGFERKANDRGGESLYGELMVIGDRTLEKVLNAGDVSILTRAGLRDDKGNEYSEAIEHVSVTPFPALTKLGGWTIAASRGGAEENVRVVEVGDDVADPEPVAPVPMLSRVTMKLASERAGIPLLSRCAAMVTLELANEPGTEGWVTLEGEHIHFNGRGVVDKGPSRLKGKATHEFPHDRQAHEIASAHHAQKATEHADKSGASDDEGESKKHLDKAVEHESKAKEHKAKAATAPEHKPESSDSPRHVVRQEANGSHSVVDTHKGDKVVGSYASRAGAETVANQKNARGEKPAAKPAVERDEGKLRESVRQATENTVRKIEGHRAQAAKYEAEAKKHEATGDVRSAKVVRQAAAASLNEAEQGARHSLGGVQWAHSDEEMTKLRQRAAGSGNKEASAKPSSEKPSLDRVKEVANHVAHDLKNEKHSRTGLVPLGEVREKVQQHLPGADAETVDLALKHLRKDGGVRLLESTYGVSAADKMSDGQAYLVEPQGNAPARPAGLASGNKSVPSGATLQASVLKHAHDIADERKAAGDKSGLVPIHEIRSRIAKEHGADAARHDVLDKHIQSLAQSGEGHLLSVSDTRELTSQQLADSINERRTNRTETHAYFTPLKSRRKSA